MNNYHANYYDCLLFNAICDTVVQNESITVKQSLLSLIEHKCILPSEGMWNTFAATEPNRNALTLLANLLRQDPCASIIRAFQEDINHTVFQNFKCKIVFLLQEHSIWPAVECLYRTAVNDERYEVQSVYVPFFHINNTGEDHSLEEYQAMGVSIISYDEYDLARENPDVVVFTKPYATIPKQFYISEVEKIVKHTVYIPYGMELNEKLIHYGFQEYTHYSVWRHLAYGNIVKEFGSKYGYRDGENIAVWGHPRVDNYHHNSIVSFNNQEWLEKIAGRKVVLWCPHHTIIPGPEHVSTWLDNQEAIFSYFITHKDVVLLWRTHPLLFGAIVNNGFMTRNELDSFVANKTHEDNIILDQTSDYRTSFSMSDAIITDGTTFSMEYLLTGKPLMVTTQSLDSFYEPEEMERSLYIGRTHSDIYSFINSVVCGEDPLREKRNEFCKRVFIQFPDMTVSENILNNILLDLSKEIQVQINEMLG